jgi:hypothetical protein
MTMESWAVAAPQAIDVEGITGVDIRLQAGSAEVLADAGATQVKIEVIEVVGRPLQVLREGARVRVGYESSGVEGLFARFKSMRDNDRAVVRVTVPPAVAVDVATVGARIDLRGSGATKAKTVTGSVHVAESTGPLSVRTVSGETTVTAHRGDVAAASVSGAVAVDGALGRVSLQTVSGGAVVSAHDSRPLVTLRTVSGQVEVRLDAGTPVSLKVRGGTAKAMLDGAVLPSSQQHTLHVDHAEQAEPGAMGVAYVSATTGTGNVRVTRG